MAGSKINRSPFSRGSIIHDVNIGLTLEVIESNVYIFLMRQNLLKTGSGMELSFIDPCMCASYLGYQLLYVT